MPTRKRIVAVTGVVTALLIISGVMVMARPFFGIPAAFNTARWLVWSHSYKSVVLSQPVSTNGYLKHIEWDGWGWGGQDTVVYLVFDPADSLSNAATSHQSGNFGGVPCEVFRVRRLESHWYTVQFYTNEDWRSGC